MAEVPLDPGLDPLVGGLLATGAEVSVVSDGFGFYAAAACAHLGIPVLTNAVDWDTGRLEFPNEDRCCACSSCGTCKQAPIKDARHRGRATVLVGDGTSDRKAALLADVVFAKDGLAALVLDERGPVPTVRHLGRRAPGAPRLTSRVRLVRSAGRSSGGCSPASAGQIGLGRVISWIAERIRMTPPTMMSPNRAERTGKWLLIPTMKRTDARYTVVRT